MAKKIWIFNHHACTPKTGPLLRHFYFAKELIKRGYDVIVFAANEIHFNDKSIDTGNEKYIIKDDEGAPFVFVKTVKYKGNGISRVNNMVSFYHNLFPVAKELANKNGKPDIIIGSSVHPLTCVAGIKIAKKMRIPCIVEIRDLWPETIFAFGKVKEKSLFGKILTSGEKWIYDHGHAIIFTKEGDVDHIKEMKWDKSQGGKIDLNNCFYINNGVNIEEFKKDIKTNILDDVDLNDTSFKVVYVGSVRPINNVGNILDAAKLLKDHKDIKILVYGTGNELELLKQRIIDEGIDNVKMKGFVDKKYIPYILSKSSANILNYSQTKYNWSRGNSSNKLFEYMASGKPVISTVKMGYSILEKYKCGFELENSTPEELSSNILKIYNLKQVEYKKYCENAEEAAKDFDYISLTNKLIKVLEKVSN